MCFAVNEGLDDYDKRHLYWPIFGDICHIVMGNLVPVSVLKLTLSVLYLSSVSLITKPGCSLASHFLELDFMAKLLHGCCFSAMDPTFCQCCKNSSGHYVLTLL